MVILRTEGLTKDFDGLRAVDDVDLRVEAGTIHSVIGPNGAGKTTLFNCLTGFENRRKERSFLGIRTLQGYRAIGSVIWESPGHFRSPASFPI